MTAMQIKDLPQRVKNKLKSISPKAWGRIILAFVCLVLLLVISLYKNSRINSLYDQNAGKYWVKENNSGSQISLFFKFGAKVDENLVNDLRYYVASDYSKIMDTTFDSSENPFGGPYTYAFSATGTVELVTSLLEDKSYPDINVMGVGGDFFIFHPVNLATGRYLDSSVFDENSIVLDSGTANRLFGSYDCLDAEILIDKIPYYVKGVYDPEENSFNTKGGDKGYAFIPYKTLDKHGKSNGISCIEFVAENPVENYLYNLFLNSQVSSLDKESFELVDNTKRFGIPNLFSVISDFGIRSMKSVSIIYPYWENVARGYEDIFAVLLIAQIFLWLVLSIMLIAYISYRFKNRTVHMKQVKDKIYEIQDNFRQKRNAVNRERAKKHAVSKKEKSKWKDF